MSRLREDESQRQRKRFSPQAKSTDDSSWPQFEDENYIVFCFKEDGAFDVLKNGNSEASSNCIDLVSASSRPLNYGEDDKAAKRCSNEKKINGKDEEGEMYEVIDEHLNVAVPTESSDSNHSDVSNGSFAFPVLGWEWSGSPVQMPKSEGLQLRKHMARCVGFQCCKF